MLQAILKKLKRPSLYILLKKLYTPTEQHRQQNIKEILQEIGDKIDPSKFDINSELPTHEQDKIREILKNHAAVFNWTKRDFTKIKTYEAYLNLTDTNLINSLSLLFHVGYAGSPSRNTHFSIRTSLDPVTRCIETTYLRSQNQIMRKK